MMAKFFCGIFGAKAGEGKEDAQAAGDHHQQRDGIQPVRDAHNQRMLVSHGNRFRSACRDGIVAVAISQTSIPVVALVFPVAALAMERTLVTRMVSRYLACL